MQISEVRVQLADKAERQDKLKAFASITFDGCFAVRDVKVISGEKGLFIAMPNRRAVECCPACNHRNPIDANYCAQCGKRLPHREQRRKQMYADVAHPVNAECRKMIHDAVMTEYEAELKRQSGTAESEADNISVVENPPAAAAAGPGDFPQESFPRGIFD